MYKVIVSAAIGFSCLHAYAQPTDEAVLRDNLPRGTRVFVAQSRDASEPELAPPPPENSVELPAVTEPASQSREASKPELAPPPPEISVEMPEAIGADSPVPAPPISENGDAKDMEQTKIYTPMPVEDEVFESQDPFLYRGDPVQPYPMTEQPFEPFPSDVIYDHDNSAVWSNIHQHQSFCAPALPPAIRRCPNDDCGRLFTVYAAGTFLRRSDPEPKLQFLNPASLTERLDASSFDFKLDSGIEAGFTAHKILSELDLDLRYFSVGDTTATSRQRFTGAGTRVNLQTGIDISGPRDVTARYSSKLSNVEANFRYRYGGGWNWTTFIVGFRYLNLDESVNARFVDPSGMLRSERADTDVDNNLYGCQIGMDKSLMGDYTCSLEGYWRAGIYRNHSDGRTIVTSAAMMPTVFSAQGSDSRNSFVGEIGLKARYALTDSLNFYGSYQILLLDGVAVASRQLAATDVVARTGHDAEGDVVYHGASFGLEYAY